MKKNINKPKDLRFYTFLGILLIYAGIFIYDIIADDSFLTYMFKKNSFLLIQIMIAFFAVFNIVSKFFSNNARLERARRVNEQIKTHKNNNIKILYLRNFNKDGVKAYTNSLPFFGKKFDFDINDSNFETNLSELASKAGYFVSLGKRDEYDIGADRLETLDDKWKETVLSLMEESSLIIFRPDTSAGLLWEFNEIVSRNYLYKTILCMYNIEDGRRNTIVLEML
jgi:hypothetical protein